MLNTGALALVAGATYDVDVDGSADLLNVTVAVSLGGATLSVTGVPVPPPVGQRLTIINNDGDDPVAGTFVTPDLAPLPEGATLSPPGDRTYTITYVGGDGNDVQLIASEAPTDINLSNATIAENLLVGAEVGVLSSVDPDAGDTVAFTLVSGAGDTDNALFTIAGNRLNSNASLDYEAQSSHSVRIRATDAGGLWLEEIFTITVTDMDEDFGDAPAPYATLAADGGAVHNVAPGPLLGTNRDADADGQPSLAADGDDLNGQDDEDGVSLDPFFPGYTTRIRIMVTGSDSYVNAWFDFNADGDWLDAGEHVMTDASISPGSHSFDIATPVNAALGATFARFRITSYSGNGAMSPTGPAADGEVEDYQVDILPPNDAPVLDPVGDQGVDEENLLSFTATASDPTTTRPTACPSASIPPPWPWG